MIPFRSMGLMIGFEMVISFASIEDDMSLRLKNDFKCWADELYGPGWFRGAQSCFA